MNTMLSQPVTPLGKRAVAMQGRHSTAQALPRRDVDLLSSAPSAEDLPQGAFCVAHFALLIEFLLPNSRTARFEASDRGDRTGHLNGGGPVAFHERI